MDHRRFEILVTQEFLHGANVVAIFEQVGGKYAGACDRAPCL